MNGWTLLSAVFGGSFFGSFLGPVLLDEWRRFRKQKRWSAPRIKLIRELFEEVDAPVISLGDVSLRAGTSAEETRELLIAMGASGTTMSNGLEGWCLDKSRWQFRATNIDKVDK